MFSIKIIRVMLPGGIKRNYPDSVPPHHLLTCVLKDEVSSFLLGTLANAVIRALRAGMVGCSPWAMQPVLVFMKVREASGSKVLGDPSVLICKGWVGKEKAVKPPELIFLGLRQQ